MPKPIDLVPDFIPVLGGFGAAPHAYPALVLVEGAWLVWSVRKERHRHAKAQAAAQAGVAAPLLAEEDGLGPDAP